LTEGQIFCANHPGVATQLRCNRCGKAICSKCAVRTPVGYRCRECVREQQQVFETASAVDHVVAFVIPAAAGFVTTWFVAFFGIFGPFLGVFIAFVVGPAIGVGVAEIVRRAIRKHRGRYLPAAAAAGVVIGSLPFLVGGVVEMVSSLRGLQGFAWGALIPAVYCFLIASTLYWRLRGIRV
jgi:MFS family permease